MTSSTITPTAPTRRALSNGEDLRARGRRRRYARVILALLVWASAGASVALWATSDAARFTGDGRLVIVAGIIAGLIGTNLILVMLILAARVPLIDRLVGHDGAMTLHGKLGKPALYLLLAHGALLVVGYSMDSGEGLLPMVVALWNAVDVRLAILALAALILVVVTSVIAVRRLFSYEAWHGIHLLSYAAVVLAVPHQLQEGQVLSEGTWQRSYWVALYALALGAVVMFRFVRPTLRSLRHRVVVERVELIGHNVASVHLRGRDLDRLQSQGGPFFVWRFWSAGTWWHAHPISLSSAPTGSTMRITVRALGKGSAGLMRLEPGTPVSFAGPYGIFTDAARTRTRVAVAASGIGITPIRAFVENLDAPQGAVTIFLRARDESETALWDEVVDWALAHGHQVVVSIGPRGTGQAGWLSAGDEARGLDALSVFPGLTESDLYICGPQRWGEALEADALAHGLPRTQLHRERFGW